MLFGRLRRRFFPTDDLPDACPAIEANRQTEQDAFVQVQRAVHLLEALDAREPLANVLAALPDPWKPRAREGRR